MADQSTNTAANDNLLMTYFSRKLVKTLHENVALYQLAEKYPLPQGSGTSMVFHGWRKLAAPSSTLSESSANASVTLSSRRVTATIQSFGRDVKFTDLLELTSIISPAEGAMRELSQSAKLALDNVIQLAVFKNRLANVGQIGSVSTQFLSAWMSSTTSAFCANTSTASYNSISTHQFGLPAVFGTSASRLSAVGTTPSISARLGPIGIRKAVRRLQRLAVDPYGDGKYAGVTHPNSLATMYGNSDWKQWQVNYSGGPQATMYKNEAGLVHNVRLISSPNIPRFAVAAHSVNVTVIMGEGCIAVTELGGGIEMIIKRPGPTSTNDPYNLNNFVAYKLRAAAAVLNPSCGVNLFTSEV